MKIILPISGLISLALGVIVLFGWYTHSTTLIQVHASFVPMQYNTALGFLVCGIGLLAITRSKFTVAGLSGFLLILLGGLTLVEYVFGIDLGIDQFFMEHYVSVKSSHPGRMAPNTALCFLLVGVSLSLTYLFTGLKNILMILGFLGGLIIALGTVPFFGYLTNIETAYGWGNLTRMAVHTSFGFIVLGVGLVFHAWRKEAEDQKDIPKWLPILVGIAAITITILIWQAVSTNVSNNMYSLVQHKGDKVRAEVLSELDEVDKAIKRMVRRWEVGGAPLQKEWQSDATIYAEHFLSLVRVVYIDPGFKVRWVGPLKGNEEIIGRDHNLDKDFQRELTRSRDERLPMVTRVVEESKDKRLFGTAYPIYHDEVFEGFIAGVMNLETLIPYLLKDRLVEGVKLHFIDKSVSEVSDTIQKARWQILMPLQFYENSWSLVVEGDADWMKANASPISIAVLIIGLLLSLVLVLAVHLALKARIYAKETITANEALISTQEKMAKANELLLEGAVEGIYGLDIEGNTTFVNPAGAEMIGFTPDELLGKPQHSLIHHTRVNGEPYPREECHIYAAFKDGKVHHEENEVFWKKDGTSFPVEYTSRPIREGSKITGAVVTFSDITQRKIAEQELILAREKAESANRAKSLFISSMSHEIRTPMNAILGYSQILYRDKELNTKQRKGVDSIQRAGKHLLDIINDILDFSKIEAGKLELHPHDFDLGNIVKDLFVIFSGKCTEKNLELRSEGVHDGQKVFVHAEAAKLRQVLVNLMGNAVKFTEFGNVVLRVMPLATDQYYFEVKDTGQGIPPEKLKTIFKSFQQDEEGIKKGGTGLGLAIASKIVSAMGGELEVESEVGKGSRFFFSLNLSSAKAVVNEKNDRLAGAIGLAKGQSVKALLIDDNRDNLNVLADTLSEIDVETILAESGYEALEKIQVTSPDIIFVDYHMPGMDGLEVTKKVQAEYGKDKIKIVMISASTFDHHREQYMKEGVHAFVGKPFIREEILGIIARLLDVEYEYDEESLSTAGDGGKCIDFSAVKLSDELYSSLKEMASMGMMTELEELLPQVESSGPEGPGLAKQLQDLVDQFDTDGIIQVLEKIDNE